MSERLTRRHRLRRGDDFRRVMRAGRRRVGRWIVVWVFRRSPDPEGTARLGLVVGRRHGGAVDRNRFKRRAREAFRRNKALWPAGVDIVVSPKTGRGGFPPAYADLLGDLTILAGQRTDPITGREKK